MFSKGRLTLGQLAHQTSLPPRQLRHGLAVLVQQNLLYHQSGRDDIAHTYEANAESCYNILRFGKLLEMVGSEYGRGEQEVLQILMQLGHARVSDLYQAYGYLPQNGGVNGGPNPNPTSSEHVRSAGDLQIFLCRLITGGIIDQAGPKTFRNPDDVFREIEEETSKTRPGEKTSAKAKAALREQAVVRFRAARDESQKLKRQLQQTMPFAAKRRKTAHGSQPNGAHHEIGDVQMIPVRSQCDLLPPF